MIITPSFNSNSVSIEVKRLLETESFYKYYFKYVENPNLITSLFDNKLLIYRPEFGHYYWPFEFLEKAIKNDRSFDEIIITVLKQLKQDLDNEKTKVRSNYSNIVILCGIVSHKYYKDTFKLVKWCIKNSPGEKGTVLHQLPQYIRNLKEGQRENEIIELFKIIYQTKFEKDSVFKLKNFTFKNDSYWLYELFQSIKEIIEKNPLPYFRYLVEQYHNVLKVQNPKKDEYYGWLDHSYISRPAIEDSEQNHGYSQSDKMITMLRDIIDSAENKQIQNEIVDILLKQKYPIFRRFALYMLTEKPEMLDYCKLLITKENLNNFVLTHEIYRFLKYKYSEIKPIIDVQTIIEGEKEKTEDIDEHEINKWKLQWYKAIHENSGEYEKEISDIEERLGYKPDHLDYITYSDTKHGWDSPLSKDELISKSWFGIKEYLLSFDVSKVKATLDFMPEYEGLAHIFKSVIIEKRDEFIQPEVMEIFMDLDLKPHYIAVIPEALIEHDNKYKENEILACVKYLNWMYESVDNDRLSFDVKITGPRYGIIYGFNRLFSYLNSIFNNDENSINRNVREKIKQLLIRFNPNIYSYSSDISIEEPYQDFINRTKGHWLEAWFALNLRLCRQKKHKGLLVEFKTILESGMGSDNFVHVILGKYLSNFYFIDKKWVIDNFSNIFPKENSDVWQVTIRSFFWSRSLLNVLFEPLIPHLQRGCQVQLNPTQTTALAERIGVFYLRSKTHAKCYKELIKPLNEEGKLSSELMKSLYWFLRRLYNENENGNKIRKLIRYRYNTIKSNPDLYPKELMEIIILHNCFPKFGRNDYKLFKDAMSNWNETDGNPKNFLDMIQYLINMKKFRETITFLEIEFNRERRLWGITYDKQYYQIFAELYEFDDMSITNRLNIIINHLGEMGYYQFSALYEKYGMDHS